MVERLKSFYDLIVIGAGPAGSSAARAAAQRGIKVLLIDQKQRIGIPVQCAELVSQWISHHAPFDSKAVIQPVDEMIVHLPDKNVFKFKNPGYMLDRFHFDKALSTSAVLCGSELSIATKALKISSEGILVQQGPQKEWVRSKVIIGADGVHSTVARWTGKPSLKQLVALQYEVVLFRPQSHTDIYFHPDYEGGYAWFFPKGNMANAGIGVTPSKTSLLPELLNRFLKYLKKSGKLPRIEIVSRIGGSIPCEPREQIVFGNILLVGDAAGHAHPISGAGILNAVLGGTMAGTVAADAITREDYRLLKNYELEWRESFGKSLQYGFSKRNFLEENWNKKEVEFKTLIQKTWVGFKEYYEERKYSFNSFMNPTSPPLKLSRIDPTTGEVREGLSEGLNDS